MIGSPEPARWEGPPSRLCFLESLEVSPSAAVGPHGSWSHGADAAPVRLVPTRRLDRQHRLALCAKRALDIAGGCVGLLLSAPVIAVAALLIPCDDRGPVFFRQRRCGRGGREFSMWKLRTMVPGAEALQETLREHNCMDGPVFKIESDPRVTRAGRVLRRFSLDELPQFWNVVIGDMSLVGPRPPLPCEVAEYTPRQRRRLSVKPGLTCTWQVSGRNKLSFAEWVELDLDYIDHWSLRRDLALIARTLPAVIRGDGAS